MSEDESYHYPENQCTASSVNESGWNVSCILNKGHSGRSHQDKTGYQWSTKYDSKRWDERYGGNSDSEQSWSLDQYRF